MSPISRRTALLAAAILFCPRAIAITSDEVSDRSRVKGLLKDIFEIKNDKLLEPIESSFWQSVTNARDLRPESLRQRDKDDAGSWERETVLIVTYPDMVVAEGKVTGFESLRLMLPYFENLAGRRRVLLHILPAFKSPMRDAGFDVSDYQQMREDLGGNAEFDNLMKDANQRGIRIMLDFITNHTSDQHPWFQKALAGDKKYQDYYLFYKNDPVQRKFKNQDGSFVEYNLPLPTGANAKVVERIIFPDFNDSVFSPVTMKDGSKTFYHHVFYKEQPDLNWFNPSVLSEFCDLMAYYANKGVSMLRLDAIPFLDKRQESHPRTVKINELLNLYLKLIAPSVRVVVEACQPPEDIVRYFGHDDSEGGTSGSRVGYDFFGMPYLWLSLPSAKKQHFIDGYERMNTLMPKNASLIRFLRVHDEFTMEKVDETARQTLRQAYLHKGQSLPFRGDWQDALGISGRLANFVDNSPEKIRLLFSMITSLPGLPLIYLGDDIAAQNDYKYLEQIEKQSGVRDTRNLGRGQLAYADFKAAEQGSAGLASNVHASLKAMLQARFSRSSMTRGNLQFVDSDKQEVVSFLRTSGKETTLVLLNLSGSEITVNLALSMPNLPWKNLLSTHSVTLSQKNKELSVKLAPYETLWLSQAGGLSWIG